MTDKLPPNLLALFAPRPQLRYLPPSDHAPEERRTARISGVAQFLPALQAKAAKAKAVEEGAPADTDDPEPETAPTLSRLEERNNRIAEKQKNQKWLVEEGWKSLYKPHDDPNVRGNPYATMFVGRLPYDTEVRDLEKEFGHFGPIERIKIVLNNGKHDAAKGRKVKKNKPRGYAFVVFEKEEDFKSTSPLPTALIQISSLPLTGLQRHTSIPRAPTSRAAMSSWSPKRAAPQQTGSRGASAEA